MMTTTPGKVFQAPTTLYIPNVTGRDSGKDLSFRDELEQQARDAIKVYDERILDPMWRLSNLYKIVTKSGKVVTFKPNFIQRILLKLLHPRLLVVKARQQGSSTFFAILALDQCLFRGNYAAAMVADKKENAENIFKKLTFAWEQFDPELKEILSLECVSDSKSVLEFSNGSLCRVSSASIHSGTYQFLHISELGPLCKRSDDMARDLWKSALPTVPDNGGFIVAETTAEGEGNFLSDLVDTIISNMERASSGGYDLPGTDFKLCFIPWFQNPEYRRPVPKNYKSERKFDVYFKDVEKETGTVLDPEQKMFYETQARDLKDDVKTQYPSTLTEAFRSSGERLFRPEILEKKATSETKEPTEIIPVQFENRSLGEIFLFQSFSYTHRYGIGADIGSGVNKDASAATVIDFTTNEVVATYKNANIRPEQFHRVLAHMGRMFGTCIIAPEVNNFGHTTCVLLHEIYPNVFIRVTQGQTEDKPTNKLGWHTNGQTKPLMMNQLVGAFEDDDAPLLVRDRTILREAAKFRRTEVLYQTITANSLEKTTRHFDLLIATAIAWQMRGHADGGELESRDQVERVERSREAVRSGKRRFN